MELVGGVTLLLDFNLLLLCKGQKEEVSKLSNSDGLLLSASNDRTVEDFTDADGRACSSASADSISVAENRRPSTVTVLQTWTCPCQGKIIVCIFCCFSYVLLINVPFYIFRIAMMCPFFPPFYRLHFVPF